MENIKFNPTGFLKNAEYSFYFGNFLSEYKDCFGDAESLIFNVEEERLGADLDRRKPQSVFSENGKTIEINISFTKFSDHRGRETILPEPSSVFDNLGFVLDKTVYRYHSQFSSAVGKRLTDYDANDIDTLKNRTLVLGLGSNSVKNTEVTEAIIGQITNVGLSANVPHIPTEIEVTLTNGKVRKASVYQVKGIYEL